MVNNFRILVLFSIVIIMLFTDVFGAEEGGNRNSGVADWRVKQNIWWKDYNVIKEAIVSQNAVVVAHPDLLTDGAFIKHASLVNDLLLLFDSMRSEKSMETLASLSPYYLGEAGDEIYSCVLLRKGRRIKPVLSQLLKSPHNECMERFAASGGKPDTAQVCFTDQEYRNRLKQFLVDIDKNVPCSLEE